ncbi:unnamed protein product [Aureobasidium uvarum]|uniref:PH domain-containing protein n=1 Tax=Aureobasidium uvarum TaxID=2773716 RepID=A0A9N8KR44_9PEZI|nr:unnamed protein product [Aureobasidium uvarum]
MSTAQTPQAARRASTALPLDMAQISRPTTRESVTTPVQDDGSQAVRPRSRRVTSYHHPFQTRCSPCNDSAPSYATATRSSKFPPAPRFFDNGKEVLPKYTCTVSREGPMQMRIEKISPFQYLQKQDFRTVYVVLNGTQLSVHKIKTVQLAGHSLPTAGRLIKRYSLQHAEMGLATDVQYNQLLPATRLAHFIPTAARRKAFEKDPDLFTPISQVVLRLRLETDQFLLADHSEERIFRWIHDLSASIDISLPLDERSAPKPCTIPRRRRRQRQETENIEDQNVIEEQERIMREMYPSLARSIERGSEGADLTRTETTYDTNALTLTATMDQEAEDIDLSFLAEDLGQEQPSTTRPANIRQTTSSTVSTIASSFQYETSPDNLGPGGKWNPPHARTNASQWRYIKRCMPTLLFDAPRATDIIICHGRRLRVNTKMDMLEEWELKPPSYDIHEFPEGLDRSVTMASSLATTSSTITASSVDTQDGKAVALAHQIPQDDLKRSSHIAMPTRNKIPERTLMEEGIVVVAF